MGMFESEIILMKLSHVLYSVHTVLYLCEKIFIDRCRGAKRSKKINRSSPLFIYMLVEWQ